VKDLQDTALLTKAHGSLVTRNRPEWYTAALPDQVPFGITRELVHGCQCGAFVPQGRRNLDKTPGAWTASAINNGKKISL
jgi:hypothetical protein